MEQGEKYFVAKITSDLLDTESGKVKKTREEKLVLGYTPSGKIADFVYLAQQGHVVKTTNT
jgi:hypothetical protein